MGRDSYWQMNKALTGSAIVALRYGRGFESLAVKTRVLNPAVTSEAVLHRHRDPFIDDNWPGSTDARTPVELTSGALAGAGASWSWGRSPRRTCGRSRTACC